MTTPDFSQYVPPSVSVVEETSRPVIVLGAEPSLVALVGPSVGYRTATRTFPLTAAGVVLPGTGVLTGAPNAPVVKTLAGAVLVAGTDYAVAVASGAVTVKTTATDANDREGTTVVVTYRHVPEGYNDVHLFSDYDDIVEAYGPPMSTAATGSDANAILSPLTLAARLAFANGASRLITVAFDAADGDLLAQLEGALAKIETDHRVGLVVPILDATADDVATVTPLAAALLNHCIVAANEGVPRQGILGVAQGFAEQDAGFQTVAASGNNKRLIVSYPEAASFFNGYTGSVITIDGWYLAAAEAGRLSAIPVQKPLTREALVGFAGLPPAIQRRQTKASKNALAASGVTVVETDRFNRLLVRHGLTTNYEGGVLNREISVVRGRDTLFTAIQIGLDNSGLIGQAIDFETLTRVKAAVSGILENATQREVILGYDNLKARQSSVDPSVIEVKFEYRPALPLNYIVVSFSINVSTGATDLAAA